MGKGRIFGSVAIFTSIVAAAMWGGCGTSNDQGISFRALGFFDSASATDGVSGADSALGCGEILEFLGIENNLAQGVNLDRIDVSYHVDGASTSIPNDGFSI